MNKLVTPVATSIAAIILLSGCITTGNGNRTMTVQEKKMREQAGVYNQTIFEGMLSGCAVGAATGAVVSKKNRTKGVLLGCGAGAVLGASAGAYIANKQEQFATQEQQLDSMINDVRTDNQRIASLVASTQQVVNNDKARIDQIDSDLAAGKITMEQAKNKMAAVDDNRAYLDNTIKELRKKLQVYADAASKVQSSDQIQNQTMHAEIVKLENQIAQLQAERDTLVQRRTISRVG